MVKCNRRIKNCAPPPDPFSIYMYMSLRFYYFILINLPGKTYQYAYAKPNEICITLKLFKMCHSSDSYARSVIRASAATVRRHSRIKSWKPLTVNELRRFLAIVFNMGLIKKTSIEEYWNTTMPSQSSKWFKKVMSRNRFQLILRFLYVSDHSRNVSRQVIFFNLFKN